MDRILKHSFQRLLNKYQARRAQPPLESGEARKSVCEGNTTEVTIPNDSLNLEFILNMQPYVEYLDACTAAVPMVLPQSLDHEKVGLTRPTSRTTTEAISAPTTYRSTTLSFLAVLKNIQTERILNLDWELASFLISLLISFYQASSTHPTLSSIQPHVPGTTAMPAEVTVSMGAGATSGVDGVAGTKEDGPPEFPPPPSPQPSPSPRTKTLTQDVPAPASTPHTEIRNRHDALSIHSRLLCETLGIILALLEHSEVRVRSQAAECLRTVIASLPPATTFSGISTQCMNGITIQDVAAGSADAGSAGSVDDDVAAPNMATTAVSYSIIAFLRQLGKFAENGDCMLTAGRTQLTTVNTSEFISASHSLLPPPSASSTILPPPPSSEANEVLSMPSLIGSLVRHVLLRIADNWERATQTREVVLGAASQVRTGIQSDRHIVRQAYSQTVSQIGIQTV